MELLHAQANRIPCITPMNRGVVSKLHDTDYEMQG
jgi:hypothetical protein